MRKNKKHAIGYVFRRKGSPIYYARWVVGGNDYCRTTHETDRAAAEEVLLAYTKPVKAGQINETRDEAILQMAGRQKQEEEAAKRAAEEADKQPALLMADAWDLYANRQSAHKKWEAFTEKVYRTRVRAFTDWLAKTAPQVKEMRDVTGTHAADFMESLAGKYSDKTIHEYRAILVQLWDVMLKKSFFQPVARLSLNPWRDTESVCIEDETERRALTAPEMFRVFKFVENDSETCLLFALGAFTGLRLGDCVNLTWENNVNMTIGYVEAMPHKTKRHKTKTRVYLQNEYGVVNMLGALLLRVPKTKRTGLLLPRLHARYTENAGGRRLSWDIQQIFRKCGIETNGETDRKNRSGTTRKFVEVGFHSLRHTYVSMQLNGGTPMAVVQKGAGHTNARQTEHYFHEDELAMKKAAGIMPDFLGITGPADASKDKLDRLAALIDELQTPEELNRAAELIAAAQKKQPKTIDL